MKPILRTVSLIVLSLCCAFAPIVAKQAPKHNDPCCKPACHLPKPKPCPGKPKHGRQLNILLTNDDGVTDNLVATYQALVAAGHNVYVFVPGDNASGLVAFIVGEYVLIEIDTNVYLVATNTDVVPAECGYVPTTMECVNFAKTYMAEQLAVDHLDVIVSGINVGTNQSAALLASGTLSGAAWGTTVISPYFKNTPAISASLANIASDDRILSAAQFVADLVDYLDEHRGHKGRLLPKDTVLNVNIPGVNWPLYIASAGQIIEMQDIKGVTLNRAGRYYSTLEGQTDEYTYVTEIEFITSQSTLNPIGAVPGGLARESFLSLPETELVAADPILADGPIVNDVAGKIAVVRRGATSFFVKEANVQAAGAVGMIVVNTSDDNFTMAAFSAGGHIPNAMIGLTDGNALLDAMATTTVTVHAQPALTADGQVQYELAEFYAFAEKPDVYGSDNTALAQGYITIVPQTLVQPSKCDTIEKMCCLLKPVLTVGPGLCPSHNQESLLLKQPQPTKESAKWERELQSYEDQLAKLERFGRPCITK